MNQSPIVAVVGRPNVGKSSLFNRLVRKPLAIVHDEPGVTRDRHYADVWALGPLVRAHRHRRVRTRERRPDGRSNPRARSSSRSPRPTWCFACSTPQTGGVEADRQAVQMLRKTGKPVMYAANKADSKRAEDEANDLYRLGIAKVFAISALHGRGIGELEHAIVAALPPPTRLPPLSRRSRARRRGAPQPARPIRVAFIGPSRTPESRRS